MDALQIIVLALLQGLTEFLPISSSAHLILVPAIVDWPDQGVAFDVSVHVGTLAAVMIYFRDDLRVMMRDWLRSLVERRPVGESRLVWFLGFGTVPVGLAGLGLMLTGTVDALRLPLVIAAATAGFALLLLWADRQGTGRRDILGLTARDVALIGCAQALSLIPGTSRSGITITAGLALGMSRAAAARFSFLLSIPVIALAGTVKTIEVVRDGTGVELTDMAAGALIAGVAAYLSIDWFLRLVERIGMVPFVVYRLVLAVLLVALVI